MTSIYIEYIILLYTMTKAEAEYHPKTNIIIIFSKIADLHLQLISRR